MATSHEASDEAQSTTDSLAPTTDYGCVADDGFVLHAGRGDEVSRDDLERGDKVVMSWDSKVSGYTGSSLVTVVNTRHVGGTTDVTVITSQGDRLTDSGANRFVRRDGLVGHGANYFAFEGE